MIVFLTYLFLCSHSPWFLEVSTLPDTQYQLLADGFLHKQLSLNRAVPEELTNLSNPYDQQLNLKLRMSYGTETDHGLMITYRGLHDFTYYHQKLYSYFGPLPVLLLIIPIKLLTHWYISETDATLIFLTLAFIAQFILLKNIRDDYFKHISECKLFIVGIALGITSNSVFLLLRPKFYELAIASTLCVMSLSMIYLYRCLLKKPSIINILLFSSLLSLAIAGRPDFIIPIALLLIGISIWVIKFSHFTNKTQALLTLILPYIVVCIGLAGYNYLRFQSIFEFGQNYMLSSELQHNTGNSLLNFTYLGRSIKHGLYYYTLNHPQHIYGNNNPNDVFVLEPEHYYVDHIVGIFHSATYVIFAIFSLLLINNKTKALQPLLHFLTFYAIIPLSLFMFLCTLSGVSQRYISNFLPFLTLISIISVWSLQYRYVNSIKYEIIETTFMVVVIYNILYCLLYVLLNPTPYEQLV